MEMIKKIIFTIWIVICLALIGWFIVSYADVCIHNLTHGYEYPSWNFFVFFMNKQSCFFSFLEKFCGKFTKLFFFLEFSENSDIKCDRPPRIFRKFRILKL